MTGNLRVLITGAGGQVGRALVASAPGAVDVVALGRDELDIADPAQVERVVADVGPALIVNTAAYTAVDKAETDAETARAVNEDGPRHLAHAARTQHARLIQLSTDYVFDGMSSRPYRPGDEPAPISVYGATKLAGERAVLETLGSSAVVLRTSWVYAANGRNFLLTMLRLLRDRQEVRVVDDQFGTPTTAMSVANAVWRIALARDLAGIFHWSDAGVASWYDFAVAIAEEAGSRRLVPSAARVVPISTADYPTPARRPAFSVLDKRASRVALELEPVHWRVNLRSVLEERARA